MSPLACCRARGLHHASLLSVLALLSPLGRASTLPSHEGAPLVSLNPHPSAPPIQDGAPQLSLNPHPSMHISLQEFYCWPLVEKTGHRALGMRYRLHH